MRGVRIEWTAAELAWVRLNCTRPRREIYDGFCRKFGRTDVSPGALAGLCKRRGWLTGRTGRFSKGHVPANQGKKMPYNAASAAHRFRPGNRSGTAARLWKPVGTERTTDEGYIERKIHDGLPMQSRWRAVHLIEWEAENGPAPDGMCLKCLDGDKTNTAPSNWTPVPRAMLPRLNGNYGRDYDHAPAEIKPAIMAAARLEHAAREARRRKS